ncbi:MAG: hypothetical protein R3Y07_04055 [Eubacteriales bacterium]
MDEKEKLRLRAQEDKKFNLACISVVIAALFEYIMIQIRADYVIIVSSEEWLVRRDLIHSLLPVVSYLALAGVIVGAGLTFRMIKTDKKSQLPLWILVLSLVIGCCASGTLIFGGTGVDMLLFLVPAWAGLALVFFLYQLEFFWATFLVSLGGVGLWMIRTVKNWGQLQSDGTLFPSEITLYTFLGITIVSVGLVSWMGVKAHKNGGKLKVYNTTFTLFEEKISLYLVLASGGLTLASLVIAYALSSAIAYYLIYALLAWLFGLLVYFTVKML